jgi:AraC-like DNA-binding protein
MHRTDEVMHKSPRVIMAGAHSAARGQHFPLHEHSSWELVYYRRGHVRSPVGADSYEASAGTLIATPPRTPHAEVALSAYDNFYVTVDAPADWPWPRVAFDDADRALGRVVGTLYREANQAGSDRDRMLELLLAELDLLLRRAASRPLPSRAQQLVADAERLLEQRHAGPVRIAEVAREVGASPSALRAQFVALRGLTPRDFLQSVRLRHALGHLRTSTITLEAIASYCGYSSASHLSRQVKAATGRSPGQLRAAP